MAKRLDSLDSLRGIAACVVVLTHAVECAGYNAALIPSRGAVMLFFVLSGYVLALPYIEGRPLSWRHFLIRRFCRLWPPLAVAVAATCLLYWLAQPRAPFIGDGWDRPMTAELVSHCLLLSEANGGCGSFVPTLWSLIFEARISAIFPILIPLILRWPVAVVAAAIILSLVPSAGAETAHFSLFFMMGILAAAYADRLAAAARSAHPALVATAGILSIVMHSDFANGLGAVALIMVVRDYRRVAAAFSRPWLLWLGRISYSLYLFHISIFLFAYYALGGPLSLTPTILCIVVSGLAASAMYRLVEIPSIQLGRLWTTPNPAGRLPRPTGVA